MASEAEKQYMGKVASLGCWACRKMGYYDTPAEIHHVSKWLGKGQRASNYDVIPLCPHHHRNGGYGEAIHAGRKAWEARFGNEFDMLREVKEAINEQLETNRNSA